MLKRILISTIVLITWTSVAFSQDHDKGVEQHGEEQFLRHRISALYGGVYVPEGHEEGEHDESKGIIIASYGLAYTYKLSHKWALGVEFNLEGGNYLIKEDIPRENAFIVAVVGVYELLPRWALFFGGGMELESHQNYPVLRIGTDYQFPIGKDWDISPTLTFDHKEVYTSWELAISVGKSF